MSESALKLVVIGDGTVGKTCLLQRFVNDKAPDPKQYVPTVFEHCSKEIELDEKNKFLLKLWDTAGQEEFDKLRSMVYEDARVVLICFSVVNPTSLDNVHSHWAGEVRNFSRNVPFILVGTKTDLRADEEAIEELRNRGKTAITLTQGLEAADRIGAISYVECSAATGDGVHSVFETATKAALANKRRKCLIL